jgi:tetratricopeptide (TPR) repeat protein
MIGLCHAERGKFSEAVAEFKNGLYVEGISERQSLALYYELGAAYEALEDNREATYYFEKVAKRDPRFRDVEKRLAGLRAAKAAGGKKAGAGAKTDDINDALDRLGE